MMATVADIQKLLERWAPKQLAMEGDNPGLQCGDSRAKVRGILLTLDATEAVVHEAQRKRATMVISHHPLIFTPLRQVNRQDATGKVIELLLKHGISMVAAHTNLDFARGGTSFALAKRIGLEQIRFLHSPLPMLQKVVTFVPRNSVDRVADAMTKAGGGTIGNYDDCSFRTIGTGTFRGNPHATPYVGKRGILEHVEEVRLEMQVPSYHLADVVSAMKLAHPYEEAAYDIYGLAQPASEAGMGALGTLPRPMRLDEFLSEVKAALKIPTVRTSARDRRRVQKVAVCGGSGARLLEQAKQQHADVFITSDVKYHAFHDAGDRTVLVDAGHYETEIPVLTSIAQYLRKSLWSVQPRIPIAVASQSTNPVFYV